MTELLDAFGVVDDDATLTIQRLLPGPIERVWAYLTDSELRQRWLAAGTMELRQGAKFELTWRNDRLGGGERPEGFPEEHRMTSRITALDPPRLLAIEWGSTGGVTFTLAPAGGRVLLTVTHRRVADRGVLLNVGAGWHAHLDVLAAVAEGRPLPPFWPAWQRLKAEYASRLG
jgi:uncharacterized protein YndB with AHSA1/START domain